jgi:hypothetical protein
MDTRTSNAAPSKHSKTSTDCETTRSEASQKALILLRALILWPSVAVRGDGSEMRSRCSRPMPAVPSSALAGFRFPPEIIVLAIRWYLRYGLSYRHVEELLGERGIEVDHVTIYRWVQRFTPLLVDAAGPCGHPVSDRWFVDETYVKVAGTTEHPDEPLDIRIGIGAGDVAVEDGDVFGTPVVEASRLCAIATGGQIVVAALGRLTPIEYEPIMATPTAQAASPNLSPDHAAVPWSIVTIRVVAGHAAENREAVCICGGCRLRSV